MKRKKEIINNLRIEKALGNYRPIIEKGNKLAMFQCVYKVLNQRGPQVLLEDENGVKIALPRNKLELLLKKGHISILDDYTYKAMPQKSTPMGGVRGEPVGTVHRHTDGFDYKKIGMSPAVWVKVGHGTLHKDAGGEAHNHRDLISKDSIAGMAKIHSTITREAHPEDHESLKGVLDDWTRAKVDFNHAALERNTPDLDKNGRVMQRSSAFPASADHVFKHADTVEQHKTKLINSLKESIKRKKGATNQPKVDKIVSEIKEK